MVLMTKGDHVYRPKVEAGYYNDHNWIVLMKRLVCASILNRELTS